MPTKGRQAPTAAPVYYWDACVFLSYIENHPDRWPDIEGLLDQAKRGDIKVCTSVLTVTEVAFINAEKAGGVLDTKVEQNIEKLWLPPSPVVMVEYYYQVALGARDLIRKAVEKRRALKPIDAIHLATALSMNASYFNTYDHRLQQLGRLVGLAIEEPTPSQQLITGISTPPYGGNQSPSTT